MRVAIVLAAGASRRMGRPKLELDLGGRSVVERSVQNLLDAAVDRVRVVVAPGSAIAPSEKVEVIPNPVRDVGLSSSLKLGLARLPDETQVVLVALADKPLVKPETIVKLIEEFERGEARVVYPVYRGERGHPVLFAAALAAELSEVEGDRGARSVLEAHEDDARAVEVEDAGVCFDIDTPEDYAAALDLL